LTSAAYSFAVSPLSFQRSTRFAQVSRDAVRRRVLARVQDHPVRAIDELLPGAWIADRNAE
jgi:hypothetical protein